MRAGTSRRLLHALGLFGGKLDRAVLQPFLPVVRLLREQRVEADEVRQLLLVAQRDHALRWRGTP